MTTAKLFDLRKSAKKIKKLYYIDLSKTDLHIAAYFVQNRDIGAVTILDNYLYPGM